MLSELLSRVSMPKQAQRDIVLPILSVWLSVKLQCRYYVNKMAHRHIFWRSGRGIVL